MVEVLETMELLNQVYLTNDKLSRSIEWFFYADSDGIIFGFTINLLCINLLYSTFINAGGPLQYYLARVFKKNSL